jgi:adenine-specific DNA methylase
LPECFERLKDVHIGCEDALDFIKRWDCPHGLIYADSPYPNTDQGHYGGYTLDETIKRYAMLLTLARVAMY